CSYACGRPSTCRMGWPKPRRPERRRRGGPSRAWSKRGSTACSQRRGASVHRANLFPPTGTGTGASWSTSSTGKRCGRRSTPTGLL
ncbi:MAG: hypothetical protein AVDCRST_MAG20-428, partial [uncultured Acidimicrobiales bacterium]